MSSKKRRMCGCRAWWLLVQYVCVVAIVGEFENARRVARLQGGRESERRRKKKPSTGKRSARKSCTG